MIILTNHSLKLKKITLKNFIGIRNGLGKSELTINFSAALCVTSYAGIVLSAIPSYGLYDALAFIVSLFKVIPLV